MERGTPPAPHPAAPAPHHPSPFPCALLTVNEASCLTPSSFQHKPCDISTSSATKKQLGRMWSPHLPSHLLQQSSPANLQDLKQSPPLSLHQTNTSPIPYLYLAKWECLSLLSVLLQRSKQLRSSHSPRPTPRMGTTSLYLPPK